MNQLPLTHWGQVTHICVSKLTIIGRRQAIIRINAGILIIGPLGANFSEILIEIYTFSFRKMHLKMSSGKWRPFCLGLNVLTLEEMWYILRSHWPLKQIVNHLKITNSNNDCWMLRTSAATMIAEVASHIIHDQLFKCKNVSMMVSSNGSILHYWPFVWGTHRWISRTKANDAELWCFLWSSSSE